MKRRPGCGLFILFVIFLIEHQVLINVNNMFCNRNLVLGLSSAVLTFLGPFTVCINFIEAVGLEGKKLEVQGGQSGLLPIFDPLSQQRILCHDKVFIALCRDKVFCVATGFSGQVHDLA